MDPVTPLDPVSVATFDRDHMPPPRKRPVQDSSPASPVVAGKQQKRKLTERESGETDWAYLIRAGPADGSEGPEGSIARRGLPPGSIARAADGFEVRSIDGIAPLVSHQAVARAMQKLAAGEEHAAAGVLRHDNTASVRAFCRAWHAAWSLPVPAALAGGEDISTAAAARIAASRAPDAKKAPLRGRLLLVDLGSGEEALEDDGRGHLLEREFESGDALAQACGGTARATYELQVAAVWPPCGRRVAAVWPPWHLCGRRVAAHHAVAT